MAFEVGKKQFLSLFMGLRLHHVKISINNSKQSPRLFFKVSVKKCNNKTRISITRLLERTPLLYAFCQINLFDVFGKRKKLCSK